MLQNFSLKKQMNKNSTGIPCESYFIPIHICPATEVITTCPKKHFYGCFYLLVYNLTCALSW